MVFIRFSVQQCPGTMLALSTLDQYYIFRGNRNHDITDELAQIIITDFYKMTNNNCYYHNLGKLDNNIGFSESPQGNSI